MREQALLEALRYYADPANYSTYPYAEYSVQNDGGQRAREALAMVEEATR